MLLSLALVLLHDRFLRGGILSRFKSFLLAAPLNTRPILWKNSKTYFLAGYILYGIVDSSVNSYPKELE